MSTKGTRSRGASPENLGSTMEHQYNHLRYNNIPDIAMKILYPGKVTVKCMGQDPDIMIFDIMITLI